MLGRLMACLVVAGAAACSLTLAPDSALSGDGGTVCDLDAAQQTAGCWLWTASSTDGWAIDNAAMTVDGGTALLDCCGCSTCIPCPDNTSMSAQNGTLTFYSGDEMSGGLNHRRDGFTARYDNVPVIPGQPHLLTFDIVGLEAQVACGDPTKWCNNPTAEDIPPKWSVAVYEQGNRIGLVAGTWGTSQCLTCPSGPSDWGPKAVSFTPATSSVMVVVSAQHETSQCASEAWGVTVATDWMSVVAQ